MNPADLKLQTARANRLRTGLASLSAWCARRATGEHDEQTTLSMLSRKVTELQDSVNRAGWRASNEQ